jgi:hypothetical protein
LRILSLAAVLLLVIISAAGGSGGNASGATDVAIDTASPAAATSAEPASGGGAPKETTEADPIATDTTEADTTDPAEAANPASALPAESRGQMQADITNLLRTWHQDIVDGDTRGAWNLLTRRKQRQSARKYGYREWADNQRTLAPYLDPSGLRVRIRDVDDRTGVVTVSVRGMRWSKPGARCSSWSGLTWVRYEDGEWLYDPGYSTTPQRERAWKDRFDELLGGSC